VGNFFVIAVGNFMVDENSPEIDIGALACQSAISNMDLVKSYIRQNDRIMFLIDWIDDESSSNAVDVKIASAIDATSHSPVMSIADGGDREIGYADGSTFNDIPGAEVNIIDDMQVYWLPADGEYSIEIQTLKMANLINSVDV
jgi:hypothetical protein